MNGFCWYESKKDKKKQQKNKNRNCAVIISQAFLCSSIDFYEISLKQSEIGTSKKKDRNAKSHTLMIAGPNQVMLYVFFFVCCY